MFKSIPLRFPPFSSICQRHFLFHLYGTTVVVVVAKPKDIKSKMVQNAIIVQECAQTELLLFPSKTELGTAINTINSIKKQREKRERINFLCAVRLHTKLESVGGY